MLPDLETEAAAALVAGAFDGASPAERRALWRGIRAAIAEAHGASWRPGDPWAAVLAELGQQTPRRQVSRLGLAPGGAVNVKPGSAKQTLPWDWASSTKESAA